MPSVITTAISKPSGDGVSGLKKIWVVEFTALNTFTETAGVITAMALQATKVFFGWAFEPGNAHMTAAFMRSRDNGTLFYEHKLSVRFNRYETTKRNELKIAAAVDLAIIALDRNGKYWLMGRECGMSQDPSIVDLGKAMGDFSGFDMAFMSNEIDLPIEVSSGVVATLALT